MAAKLPPCDGAALGADGLRPTFFVFSWFWGKRCLKLELDAKLPPCDGAALSADGLRPPCFVFSWFWGRRCLKLVLAMKLLLSDL